MNRIRLQRLPFVAVLLVTLAVPACKGSGSSGPTAPSAVTPPGCSGQAINNVAVSLGSGGGFVQRFTFQVFGETVSATAQTAIVRSVVPCEYELTGQLFEGTFAFLIGFGFMPGVRAPDRGGIDPASIVVMEGPNPSHAPPMGAGVPGCLWSFGLPPQTQLPANIRIRFRVSPDIREGTRC